MSDYTQSNSDLYQQYTDGLITLDEFERALDAQVDAHLDARLDEILRAVSYHEGRENEEEVAQWT